MLKTKQIREDKSIKLIRDIIKSGRTITNVKYNGQPGPYKYVLVQYIEPKTLTV